MVQFRKNAEGLRRLQAEAALRDFSKIQDESIRAENNRLLQLLELRPDAARGLGNMIYARVIARSPKAWNKVFLIDKGFEQKVRLNLPVFSGKALIGKVVEVGAHASKVLLLTDPSCRIAVILERTRDQGILYGTPLGECRIKYLSAEAVIQPGDLVQTAGLGGFFPKGIPVGKVVRAWKEPGQIYQVAQVRLDQDLGTVEEVSLLDIQ